MKTINLQKNPIVPARQVIKELEEILFNHGYRGANWAVDIGLFHHQRCYEVPNEGAVYLNATDKPSSEGYASQVSFLGFNESESRTLRELEADVAGLGEQYLRANIDLIGQTLLNAMAARQG